MERIELPGATRAELVAYLPPINPSRTMSLFTF